MVALSYGSAIRYHAQRAPGRPAVTDGATTFTRSHFDWLSDIGARRLKALGVGFGDVVAFTGANSARLLALAFAIWKLGAIPFPISASKSRSEIEHLLALGKPKAAVGFADCARTDALLLSLSDAFTVLSDAEPPEDVTSPQLRIGASGGSTGMSKLIVIDSPALANPTRPWPAGMTADGTQVMPLNLTDGTGFVMATIGLVSGCHVVLMPEFDAEATLRLVERYKADWVPLTPPLMLAIWKLGPSRRDCYDLGSLRAIGQYSGGAAQWLKRAWIDWLGPERVWETYGATDARGGTQITGSEWLSKPGSVGRASKGCEISIIDRDGVHLPSGSVGDIHIRDLTGHRNFHYLGGDTRALPGGWECFGDVGWMDDDGYLYVGDRGKDVIQTPAGLVFPQEIEGEIERHDAVRSAVVIGLPCAGGNERLHALVDAPGVGIDGAGLARFLLDYLSPAKIPESFEFCAGPLRDTAGKARRSQMRADRLVQEQPA